MIAFATRYEVSAQVASSGVAPKLPAMCGRETLTTVVSSTSIKVLAITATATSQGLTAGASAKVRVWTSSAISDLLTDSGCVHGADDYSACGLVAKAGIEQQVIEAAVIPILIKIAAHVIQALLVDTVHKRASIGFVAGFWPHASQTMLCRRID